MPSTPMHPRKIPSICDIPDRRIDTLSESFTPSEESDLRDSEHLSAQTMYFLFNGIRLQVAHTFFTTAGTDTFESLIDTLYNNQYESGKNNLIYYTILFRNEPHLIDLIRTSKLPLKFPEEIILSIIQRPDFKDDKECKTLDDMLSIFSQQTLYDLITTARSIQTKSILILDILSKMETFYLDKYFGELVTVKEFVIEICRMPKNMIQSYFLKNPKLHGYYTMLLNAIDLSDIPNAKEFCSFDLTEVDKVKKIAVDISFKFDLKKEKNMPLPLRNSERFAFIVSRIRNLNDIRHVLESLESEGVICGEECSLIEEIMQNPLFKDVLEKYSDLNETSESRETSFLF